MRLTSKSGFINGSTVIQLIEIHLKGLQKHNYHAIESEYHLWLLDLTYTTVPCPTPTCH